MSNFEVAISRMGCPICMNQKGHTSIYFWFHYMALTFDPVHDLDHEFSRASFEIAVYQERVVRGNERGMDAGLTV